jgi:hypothetical protein
MLNSSFKGALMAVLLRSQAPMAKISMTLRIPIAIHILRISISYQLSADFKVQQVPLIQIALFFILQYIRQMKTTNILLEVINKKRLLHQEEMFLEVVKVGARVDQGQPVGS